MKKILISIALLISPLALASGIDFAAYEKMAQKEIQGKSSEDKFYIYSLFARELLGLKEFDLSQKYYLMALKEAERNKELDQSEAHNNLLYIQLKRGASKESMQERLALLKQAIAKRKDKDRFKTPLMHWEALLEGEANGANVNEELLNSFYGASYAKVKVKELVENKKFAEALALYSPNLKDANIALKVERDILTKLALPESKTFLCADTLKKYPNAHTYTMLICKWLHDKNAVSLDAIEEQLKAESKDRLFWLTAMKEVK